MRNFPVYRPSGERRHDIDALRVLAFALLIFYHVGMFYVAGWGWHVKSAYTAEWLQVPMLLVNQWRLPLLFLISGVGVHFLLRRASPGRFAILRTRRLLIPLIFGMLVIVPPQAWVQAMYTGAFEGGYAAFLADYFGFRDWPEGAFDGSDIGVTWNHLWFLPYLLFYSLILAALLPAFRSAHGQRLVGAFRSLRARRLYLLPVLPFVIYAWTLRQHFPETHAFFDDWYAHAVYGTVFLLGYAIGRDRGLWAEFARLRGVSSGLAAMSFTVLMIANAWWPEEPAVWMNALVRMLICFNSWFWLMAVLGWGHRLLNRPFRWLPYANEAVYPWYVLHQTITVLLGYWLSPMTLGAVAEPMLLIGGTLVGCLVVHEFVVRRSRLLRQLFGLHITSPPRESRVGPQQEVSRSGPAT